MATIIVGNPGMPPNADPNNPQTSPMPYPMRNFYPLYRRIHHHKKKKHKKRSHK